MILCNYLHYTLVFPKYPNSFFCVNLKAKCDIFGTEEDRQFQVNGSTEYITELCEMGHLTFTSHVSMWKNFS